MVGGGGRKDFWGVNAAYFSNLFSFKYSSIIALPFLISFLIPAEDLGNSTISHRSIGKNCLETKCLWVYKFTLFLPCLHTYLLFNCEFLFYSTFFILIVAFLWKEFILLWTTILGSGLFSTLGVEIAAKALFDLFDLSIFVFFCYYNYLNICIS